MPEILEAEVISTRPFDVGPASTGGPITLYQPTPTFPIQNQQAPRPPAPPTPGGNSAWDAATYRDAAGNLRWRAPSSIPDDFDIYDDLTGPPRIPDPVPPGAGRIAGEALPGAVGGGIVTGIAVGAATGSVAQGIGAGAGSTVGEVLGTAAGAAAGSVLGPPGAIAGGIIGGVIGGALGGALGQQLGKMIDPESIGDDPIKYQENELPFRGGQCPGQYAAGGTIKLSQKNVDTGNETTGNSEWSNGWFDGPISGAYTVKSGAVASGENISLVLRTATGDKVAFTTGTQLNSTIVDFSYTIDFGRRNGQADSCGDPAPQPVTKVKPAVRLRPIAGGFPEIDWGLPQPDVQPVGGTPPGAEPLPFPELPGQENYPYPDPSPPPVAPPAPAPEPPPSPQPPRQPPGPRPPGNDCPCSIPVFREVDELKKLLEKLLEGDDQPPDPMQLQPVECGEGEAVTLATYELAIQHLSQQVRAIQEGVCGLDLVPELPESFAIKSGSATPQALVQLAPVDGGSSRWRFTIPHPNFNEQTVKSTGLGDLTFQKGGEMLNIVLRDNSQCVLNLASREECARVWEVLKGLISPQLWMQDKPKITSGIQWDLKRVTVKPVVVKFYSTGDKNLIPDWVVKL